MLSSNEINKWADFWHYQIGVNVIPADTREKRIYENWSQWQDKSFPDDLHEQRKRNGEYNRGIAILTGKSWRGKYEGKYLIGIDCDNKKAIEEICTKDGTTIPLKELAKWTIVEQHIDNPEKAHIYILSTKPFKNKSSTAVNLELDKNIENNAIPAIEVKCEKHTMFCTPSIHKDGYPYEILDCKEPVLCDEFELHIDNILKKYGIQYLDQLQQQSYNNKSNSLPEPLIQIINLLDIPSEFHYHIPEGARHDMILSFADSVLIKHSDKNRDKLKDFFIEVNNKICVPPLPESEVKTIWHDALRFSEDKIAKIKIINNDENDIFNYKTPIKVQLEIDNKLLEQEIVQGFVYDIQSNSICCDLNHKYNKKKIIVPIDIKKWDGVRKTFQKLCNEKGISNHHILLLLDSLDINFERIKKYYYDKKYAAAEERKKQRLQFIEEGTQFVMSKYRFLTIEESKDILFYDKDKGVYVYGGGILIEKELDKKYGFQLKTSDITEIKNYVMRKTYTKIEKFDANLDIINLENGLYNWRTAEFFPHTPDYYSLNQKPFPYNPEVRPKLFIKFLKEVLYLQDIRTAVEIIAYSFIRKNLFEYYFILIGSGSNGKSVFIGILSNLHGLKNISNVSLKSLVKGRFALVDLVNKDINVDTELASTSINDMSTLKKLTGTQPLRVEQKGQPAYDVEIYAKQIFNANELPTTSDNSDSHYRREIILSFPNQFEGENEDPNLLNKFITNKEEISGIFNLVVNSMRTIVNRNKIHVHASTISQRRAKAKLIQDPIGAFLEEALAKEPAKDDYETSEDMHDAFERFCQHHTLSGPGFDKFSEDLRKIHGLNKGRKMIDGKKKTIWQGCKLVKWKNTIDSSQKTLMNEKTEEEKKIQEQPLEREQRGEEKKESREEKWLREQEEIRKWE